MMQNLRGKGEYFALVTAFSWYKALHLVQKKNVIARLLGLRTLIDINQIT